jgi:hemoglobin
MRSSAFFFGVLAAISMNLSAAIPAAAEDAKAAAPAEKSLYERIGGYKAIAAASENLVDRLYRNATLNKNPALKAVHDLDERAAFKLILSTWVMENTGGPKVYFGRPMDKAHAHLSITNREFDVIMHECLQTFYELGVPQKETDELMAGLQSFRDQIVTVK